MTVFADQPEKSASKDAAEQVLCALVISMQGSKHEIWK